MTETKLFFLTKKYKNYISENFDDYLEEVYQNFKNDLIDFGFNEYNVVYDKKEFISYLPVQIDKSESFSKEDLLLFNLLVPKELRKDFFVKKERLYQDSILKAIDSGKTVFQNFEANQDSLILFKEDNFYNVFLFENYDEEEFLNRVLTEDLSSILKEATKSKKYPLLENEDIPEMDHRGNSNDFAIVL